MRQPLDALVDALRELFAAREEDPGGGGYGKRIAALLAEYAREHDDWRPYALFAEDTYARNRIAREEHFELLLLCWGEGQESPIHNHEGQDCWMAVMDGHVEELRYCTPEEVVPGPLRPRDASVFETGGVAFIRDEIGLHLVRSAHDAPAVSLHLYAAPYTHCNVYCPETGRVTRKRLGDHSVRGVLV